MSWEREVEELRKRRAAAAELGGAEAIAKQHARGRLTVRERIDALVDKGSFREQGAIAGVSETDAEGNLIDFSPTNAVIGTAKIDGRPVVICGDDFTLRGGSYSPAGMQKAEYADRQSARLRVPNVRLLEAGGASVSGITGVRGRSGYDFVAGAHSNAALLEARATVPMVAAALGPVAGYPAGRLVAAHFSLMTRGTAQVLVGGPALVARATGEEVDKQELGGADVHGRNGVVDNVAEDEADVFRQIRAFLSYLPSNVWEGPPVSRVRRPARPRRAEADRDRAAREPPRLQDAPDHRGRGRSRHVLRAHARLRPHADHRARARRGSSGRRARERSVRLRRQHDRGRRAEAAPLRRALRHLPPADRVADGRAGLHDRHRGGEGRHDPLRHGGDVRGQSDRGAVVHGGGAQELRRRGRPAPRPARHGGGVAVGAERLDADRERHRARARPRDRARPPTPTRAAASSRPSTRARSRCSRAPRRSACTT